MSPRATGIVVTEYDDGAVMDRARDRARMPSGTAQILDVRTLETSHRRLAEMLKPGMSVLDVGCGGGTITRDIAHAVGVHGRVVGVDIDEALIAHGRAQHGREPALHFVRGDIHALPLMPAFDVATAARVLQWLARPLAAVEAMRDATKPGGAVVVLDYDHEQLQWLPAPPPSVSRFYAAFLRWRAEAGMDNAIARRLPAHFEAAGLVNIRVTPQHERTVRGDVDFPVRIGIWAAVAATRGAQMVSDGVLTETERAIAEADYRAWIQSEAESQTLHLLSVEGVVRGA